MELIKEFYYLPLFSDCSCRLESIILECFSLPHVLLSEVNSHDAFTNTVGMSNNTIKHVVHFNELL